MYGRLHAPALNRVVGRQVGRAIHWRAPVIPADWISAHRAGRIDARVAEARDQAFRQMQGFDGRCRL